MVQPLDNVTKWKETGLLEGVNSDIDRKNLADTLEEMAFFIVENDMVNLHDESNVDIVIFPIIREIMLMNGYQPLRNLRDLYRKAEREWEKTLQHHHDAQSDFIRKFSEENANNFTKPPDRGNGLPFGIASLIPNTKEELLHRSYRLLRRLPHAWDCQLCEVTVTGRGEEEFIRLTEGEGCTCGRDELLKDFEKHAGN